MRPLHVDLEHVGRERAPPHEVVVVGGRAEELRALGVARGAREELGHAVAAEEAAFVLGEVACGGLGFIIPSVVRGYRARELCARRAAPTRCGVGDNRSLALRSRSPLGAFDRSSTLYCNSTRAFVLTTRTTYDMIP